MQTEDFGSHKKGEKSPLDYVFLMWADVLLGQGTETLNGIKKNKDEGK